MKPHFIAVHIVLVTALLASGRSTFAQTPLNPKHPGLEKFIVFIRDAKDNSLIRDVEVNPRAFTPDGKERTSGASGHTDDGMILIGLGEGRYQLVFQAEGYHPLMVKDCIVRTRSAYGMMVAFAFHELAYQGEIFTYSVYLDRTEGRKPQWRFQQFLSDTTYYAMPETLPQLLGGERSLKDKLTPEGLRGEPNARAAFSSVTSMVWLEKDGSIGKLEVYGDAPKSVQKKVEDAVRTLRFTPAKILGNPVRSRVCIPFEFALDWKEK
jgi:hypothetical protein